MPGKQEHTVGSCLSYATELLDAVDARLLCESVLGTHLAMLYSRSERTVSISQFRLLAALIERRQQGEPIAYILGTQGFWKSEFKVTKATLIPRPETETLVELVLPHISSESRVLDLGCGCGAIGLSIALQTGSHLTLADISIDALQVAKKNAHCLAVEPDILESDWYSHVDSSFDCIVSNPPYIAEADEHLDHGDLRYEPKQALVGGVDGLAALSEVIASAPEHLVTDGLLAVEHGYNQATEVNNLFQNAGFARISTQRDLQGHTRVTMGIKS